MSSATKFHLIPALLLGAGCSSIYHMSTLNSAAELSQQQKSTLIAKKYAVPCRVEVICPGDMVGKYDTFFTSNVCHYPLEQILEHSYSDAVYTSFEQPGGEVLDAFTLKVEVYKSELKMDSSEATYNLSLNIALNEPGEKKVTTFCVEKSATASLKGDNPGSTVPDAVYQGVKEAVVDTISKLKLDPKVVKTVKRFEKK